jgi:CRISPR/Cas system-associated endoribonuclease Cas2
METEEPPKESERVRFANRVRAMRLLQKKLFDHVQYASLLGDLRRSEKEVDTGVHWIKVHRRSDRLLHEDACLVSAMRNRQVEFVKGDKSPDNIRKAKDLEKRVDQYLCNALGEKQGELPLGGVPSVAQVISQYGRRWR